VTRKSGARACNFGGSRAKGRHFVGMDQGEKSNGVEGVAGDEAMGLEEAVRKASVCELGGRIAKKRQLKHSGTSTPVRTRGLINRSSCVHIDLRTIY
jgi:hypothetical protein